jgi:uncharacterized protein YndB with AHSA1/START domain
MGSAITREAVCKAALPALAAVLLNACAVHGDWRLQQETDAVRYFEREHPGSAIPEFRAEVRIRASLQDVMNVLTDFASHPNWIHRLASTSVIRTVGFAEAYLYQVVDLPLIADRDMLVHGRIVPVEPGEHVVLELEAAPDYCEDKTIQACEAAKRSGLVRVRQLSGTFDIRRVDPDRVEVSWQQHLDPGGAVPAWATRLMLKDVPIESLRNLKALVEGSEAQSRPE